MSSYTTNIDETTTVETTTADMEIITNTDPDITEVTNEVIIDEQNVNVNETKDIGVEANKTVNLFQILDTKDTSEMETATVNEVVTEDISVDGETTTNEFTETTTTRSR